MKNKAKELIIVFIDALVCLLIQIFMIAFLFVPCLIIDTMYFIVPWVIFIATLYYAILRVFLYPLKNKE